MKKIFFSSILLLIQTYVFAQEAALELEINIRNNYPNSVTIQATLTLVSLCWDADINNTDVHNLTSSYPGSTVSTNSTGIAIGWNVCWRTSPDQFGLGKYKVDVSTGGETFDYFYIDYRTSDLPEAYTSWDDIKVYLNANDGQLYWDEDFENAVGYNYTIWDLSSNIDLITTELEPLQPTNLIQTATSGAPQLQWQHPTQSCDYRTGYRIYRRIGSSGGFSLLTTVACTTNTYTDNGLVLNGSSHAYYYVVALNGTRESAPSNTIDVNIVEMGKQSHSIVNERFQSFSLEQNYPNPFNALTKIKFRIPGNSLDTKKFVSVNVYNVLGNEVAVLVNDFMEAGLHEIDFNAEGLPGGVYMYRLEADNFSETKKLIYLK